MSDKFLSLGDVMERVALSKPEIYRRANAGEFPKSIPLGRYKVVWLASEIDDWMAERVAARDRGDVPHRGRDRAMRAVAGREAR